MTLQLPLHRLPAGTEARILFVPPGGVQLRLASLGLVVGAAVCVRQAAPVVLVSSGATTLALEAAVAERILVRCE